MKQFDLILFNEQIHRILFIKGDSALIINCITLNMPYWVQRDELSNCSRVENALKKLPDIASLSPQKQRLAHHRYTLIAPVLPFINNEYMRSKLITQVSEINYVSKQTIRKYLCSFLAYGVICYCFYLLDSKDILLLLIEYIILFFLEY